MKKPLALILALVMVFAMTVPAFADEVAATEVKEAPTAAAVPSYSDIQGHWAADVIAKWSTLQVVKGNEDGTFKPNAAITRGEMAVVFDRLMNYQTKAADSFSDLGKHWAADAVLKANHAGIILGGDGKVRPTANITRQEAAVMMTRALGLTESVTKDLKFTDSTSIASWAVGSVNAMAEKGYMVGTDGKFNPESQITRAEIVKILDNAIKAIVAKEGVFTANQEGTVIVNVPKVELKDMTIKGDLIIAEGVGVGEVVLNNVKVEGTTTVKGGGVNSIKLIGNTVLGKVVLAKVDGGVRLVTEGNAKVEVVFVNDGLDNVILTGKFAKVEVATSDVKVSAVNATITNMTVNAPGANVVVEKGSTVTTVTVAAANATIGGAGKVTNAIVKANDVAVNTVGTKLAVDKGITGSTANGATVEGGKTVVVPEEGKTPTTPPSGGSGGSSGGDTNYNRKVTVSIKRGDALPINTFVDGTTSSNLLDIVDQVFEAAAKNTGELAKLNAKWETYRVKNVMYMGESLSAEAAHDKLADKIGLIGNSLKPNFSSDITALYISDFVQNYRASFPASINATEVKAALVRAINGATVGGDKLFDLVSVKLGGNTLNADQLAAYMVDSLLYKEMTVGTFENLGNLEITLTVDGQTTIFSIISTVR